MNNKYKIYRNYMGKWLVAYQNKENKEPIYDGSDEFDLIKKLLADGYLSADVFNLIKTQNMSDYYDVRLNFPFTTEGEDFYNMSWYKRLKLESKIFLFIKEFIWIIIGLMKKLQFLKGIFNQNGI